MNINKKQKLILASCSPRRRELIKLLDMDFECISVDADESTNEIIPSRCKILTGNIERLGLQNTVTTCMDTKRLARSFPHTFDLIMVDAPCSGEGMFRKDKKMVKAWEEHGPEFFANIQKSIILQAARMLKPGGMILYSTCTFDPEENEGTIEYLLNGYVEAYTKADMKNVEFKECYRKLHKELKYDYDKGYEFYKGAFGRLAADDDTCELNMTKEDFYV